MSFNQVTLIGNLTRDPALKYVGESSVCEFGVATNRKWKTASGEAKEEVMFIDCAAWGKTGELVNQYYTKGKPIMLVGSLKLECWEKDGNKRSKHTVRVDQLVFLPKNSGGSDATDGSEKPAGKPTSRPSGKPTAKAAAPAEEAPAIDDADIPF